MSLILVLGDQLTPSIAALSRADRTSDFIVMVEVAAETDYVPHHPKKIALIFAAMRKFAARCQDDGWTVLYTRLDDPENAGSIPGELIRRAEQTGASRVIATRPGEWRLIEALEATPLHLEIVEDRRFIASHSDFDDWAAGRKELRMEWFYREMRRKTGLLMDGDVPAGDKWNYDTQNRKPAKPDLFMPHPPSFEPDKIVREVLDLVETRFTGYFGLLNPFALATDPDQAEKVLAHFLAEALPRFGDFQDAMLTGERILYHAVISPYLNIGLLDPLDVCRRAEAEWRAGRAPLNCVEGFIRQILGWREYVRGVYFREGPDYSTRNILKHTRDLPALYWGKPTRMNCLSQAVAQTREDAYAHHIQRLMVTGNFALLAGVDPAQVHEWYLSVYFDAYEWVEAPNTIGMSQFADGGLLASKPYVSSGAYIDRMSDYCRDCTYSVEAKTGKDACPFNLLYWHFLHRHRDRFERNRRMAVIYGAWDKMDVSHRDMVLHEADGFLDKLEKGMPV